MNLEQFIAHRNGITFWKEFTFTQLKFRVPAGEAELADNVVWFGETALIIQMKEREVATDDPEIERKWFDNKVMKAAVRQIKDSLRFLDENGSIPVANVRGQELAISQTDLKDIRKIIVYKPGTALPVACRQTQFYISQTAGFAHIIDQASYGRVLEILVAPEEIRRYMEYRERALTLLEMERTHVAEDDLLAAYAMEEVPTPQSHRALKRLVENAEQWNLSRLLGDLADHIENPDVGQDYSRILIEFAKLPRAGWYAAKERINHVARGAANGEFVQPYRFYFEGSDCSFVFTPIHPNIDSATNRDQRGGYLEFVTEAGKYLARAGRGVGVQVTRSGDDVLIDWCLVDKPWKHDENMEIAAKSLFRPVREKRVDGFLLQAEPTD
ncbi:hypothetical protein HF264_14615 [Rhizobium leguminosarum]|jgi:hypothetical protein|uniref:hypothetical protein n=1 Tax=Rhizobium leguminosarum TaxID=384 RepID=UPI001C900416|nr:hypothetical protein [Rhizobium leguminosarum]MBY2940932.1 hypothetical protein [Rhizobium leguminosarum]